MTLREYPRLMDHQRRFNPLRFAFYLASELNAREHSNGWGLNCARIPEKRIARACRHGVFAAQPRVPISSDHAAISIEAEDSRRSERSLRAPILCVPNVKRSADVRCRTSVGTSKASRVNASPLGLRRQAHFLRVGTLTAPRITPANRKGSASTQAEAPHSLETRRQFSPRRFASFPASKSDAWKQANGGRLDGRRSSVNL